MKASDSDALPAPKPQYGAGSASAGGSLRELIAAGALSAVFQPIVRLSDGLIVGQESLARGPQGSALVAPDAMFAAAREAGLTRELELLCLKTGIGCWVPQALSQRLFLNVSAATLVELINQRGIGGVAAVMHELGIAAANVTLEVTEHERVTDAGALLAAAEDLRALGVRFALDDFGDGRSSLRLWAELHPEIVKIDQYFVRDVHNQAVKVQMLKGLIRLAETWGTQLVAEGIESEAELRVLRDLGIEFGQGYFLGRPATQAIATLHPAAAAVIGSAEIAILPELRRVASAHVTVQRLTINTEPLLPTVTVDELAQTFAEAPDLRAVAVVSNGQPLGLINRQAFMDRYARPYVKELYGRKGVLEFADTAPLTLERNAGLEAMTAVLTSADQRYLREGFLVTDNGQYVGIGTGEALVRVVTDARIEAARHANPLTFLPGNIPLSEHIERLLSARCPFVACYADMNDFKPFNDHYGYWRGDEMIRLLARTLVTHAQARRDFVGHVGGDDFVLLFQSEDWLERSERIVADFNRLAMDLFDDAARRRGGIDADDRHGIPRFFKCTTLSLGLVPVRPGQYSRAEQVASSAAAAKHRAKTLGSGLFVAAVTSSKAAQSPSAQNARLSEGPTMRQPGTLAVPG